MSVDAGEPEPRDVAADAPRDLRFALRAATDAAHRRLDLGFATHGADAADLPPDWPSRRRSAVLQADLGGLAILAPEVAPTPLPRTLSGAEAPGLLYVLEGSRLGGQVLLRQVLASPDPLVRGNAGFLQHGAGLRLWPSFATWLGTRPASDHAAAIRGAQRAFALFEAAQARG
jgi:heme oxygenase